MQEQGAGGESEVVLEERGFIYLSISLHRKIADIKSQDISIITQGRISISFQDSVHPEW